MAGGFAAAERRATTRACGRSPALRKPVDRFFDDVLVMAEDPKVRGNRLALLTETLSLFYRIADISRLGGQVLTQYVYFFGGGKADGHKDMKDLLGGKGSGLAEMTNAGLPVPPGFTISTEACNVLLDAGGKLPPEVDAADRPGARTAGRRSWARARATPTDPLLVSVRSGAKFSMPGMMDTILNLGLNDRSVEGLKAKTGNGRFAKDCYRRFIQMYGNVVLDIDKDGSSTSSPRSRRSSKVKADLDLDEKALDEVIARYKAVVQKETGQPFPQDSAGPAPGRPRRRLQVLDEPARRHLPAAERHPARPRAPR